MQAERNAGLVPKKVARSRAAKRHSAPMSGWPGFPSNCRIVQPVMSVETQMFHMIQFVDENQKNRSASPTSRCSVSVLRFSRIVPP